MSDRNQMKSVFVILAGMFLIAVAAVLLVLSESHKQGGNTNGGGNPATVNFTLHSASGPVSLSDFRGSVVLLFFGYTHCPDICPLTMNHVAEAMNLLTPQEAARAQPLFVTVDPQRDTPEHLAEYMKFFHPKLIGLGGSEAEVQLAARALDVEYFKDAGDEKDYLVNHTSYLFLIDGDGVVADMMSHRTSPEDIAAAVRRHLR